MARHVSDYSSSRDNNFALIRLLAATLVVFNHCFPLASGPGSATPLAPVHALIGRGVAVDAFFLMSGFLLVKSFHSSASGVQFLKKRLTRILPGLGACLLVSAYLLGPLMTTLSVSDYFSARATHTYTPANLSLVRAQGPLPGVFEANPFGNCVNGSLWSLFHVVCLYFAIAGLGTLRVLRGKLWFGLFLFALLAISVACDAEWVQLSRRLDRLRALSVPFFLASGMYVFRQQIPMRPLVAALLIAAAVISLGTPLQYTAFAFVEVYLLFWLAVVPAGWIRKYNNVTDYSYGVYLYGFPVQQTVAALFPGIAPLEMFVVAMPVVVVLAVLSYRLIEGPAMRWIAGGKPKQLPIDGGHSKVEQPAAAVLVKTRPQPS